MKTIKWLLISICSLWLLFPAAISADEIVPSCEIKLLLDSDLVLDEDQLLTQELRDYFQTGEEYKTIHVAYLDTAERDYLNEGWINRIRVKEGKKKYTLTYKKRYPVEDDHVEAALEEASRDGFSSSDSPFSAEIDWGYSKMTLSFSCDVGLKTDTIPDLDVLEEAEAVSMIQDHMPSMEAGLDVEVTKADQMEIAGPIHYLRYSGMLGDYDIHIEIWPIPDGEETIPVVELSAKCDDVEEAAEEREDLIEILDEMGILMHSDALKTQMILGV